jgi:phosphate starvation-inducible PhoH-like protein
MTFLSYLVLLSFLAISSARQNAAKFKFKNNNNDSPLKYYEKKNQQQQHNKNKNKNKIIECIEHFPQKRPNPIGVTQEMYVDYLEDPSIHIVAAFGSAGTGKTMFACHAAMESLHASDITKIIITRPVISVGDENIGFLPGDISQKMNPWMLPIFDVFEHYYTKVEIQKKIKDGMIEISPLGYMRGRTFNDCFILLDEAQNTTPEQMFMITTRIGKNCKLIITGDLRQSDLREQNGLYDLLQRAQKRLNATDAIRIVEFTERDIMRSKVVQTIMKLYNNNNTP